uniref:Uncharacterized protein n=1 Tax=Canis lupus dingo TaxID=286419 RepID=A0A8C0QYA4_CANLU
MHFWKGKDTMNECNPPSNLPLTIWCLNTLVYISGVVCKPKLTYSVVSFFSFFLSFLLNTVLCFCFIPSLFFCLTWVNN